MISPGIGPGWRHRWLEAGGACFFLPEKDDEVLVAFEQGDITRPYVLEGNVER